MKKVIIIIALLVLTGCAMVSVTPDNVELIVYDGEDTLDGSVKAWQEYEREHK